MTINEVRVASRRYWSTCSLTRLFIRCRTKTKLKFPRNLIFLKINHSYPACYFSDSTRRPMQCLMQALRPFQTFVIFVTVGHMCDFKQLEFSQTTRFLVASASCGKHPWHCYSFPFCDRDICTCGGLGFRPASDWRLVYLACLPPANASWIEGRTFLSHDDGATIDCGCH